MLDLQPTLRGHLVVLRPLVPEDYDALFAAASDPLVWAQHPESDRYTAPVFQRYFDGALASKGAFTVLDARTSAVIGSTRFNGYDPDARTVEVGWTFLARPYWGGAYNAEMKRLLLDHAFGDVDTVVFMVGAQNYRSRRAVEKIGGVLAGTRVDPNGQESLRFELTRARFAGGPARS